MNQHLSTSGQILNAFLRGDSDAAIRMLRQAGGNGAQDLAVAIRGAYRDATGHQPASDLVDNDETRVSDTTGSMGADVQVPPAVRAALRRGDVLVAGQLLSEANPDHDMVSLGAALDRLRQAGGRGTAYPRVSGHQGAGQRGVDSPAAARDPLLHARSERPPTVAPGDHGGGLPVILALLASILALAWWALV